MSGSSRRDEEAHQRAAMANERRLYRASHPVASRLVSTAARLGPIVSLPGIGHVVSDMALAREVLADPERFAKTGPGALSDLLTRVIGQGSLVNMDGEQHRLLRTQLRGLFAPSHTSALVSGAFADPLRTAVEHLAAGLTIDIVHLAQVLSGRIACAILGIELPASSSDTMCVALYRQALELFSILGLTSRRLSDRQVSLARNRLERLTEVGRAAFQSGDPQTLPGQLHSLGLDFDSSRGIIALMFVVGTETTAAVLPRLVALLVDTGQWKLLRENRQLMAGAIDEGLRITAAVPVMTRNVARPTTLGGRSLAKDSRVIVALLHALQSSSAGHNPKAFDIKRRQSSSVANQWFGHGPHFCPGATLARHELVAALGTLLDCDSLEIVRRRSARRAIFAAYSELQVRNAGGISPPRQPASPPLAMNSKIVRVGQ